MTVAVLLLSVLSLRVPLTVAVAETVDKLGNEALLFVVMVKTALLDPGMLVNVQRTVPVVLTAGLVQTHPVGAVMDWNVTSAGKGKLMVTEFVLLVKLLTVAV